METGCWGVLAVSTAPGQVRVSWRVTKEYTWYSHLAPAHTRAYTTYVRTCICTCVCVCVCSVFKCLNSYFADEEHVKMKVSIKAPRAVGETVEIKCDITWQNLPKWMRWSPNSVCFSRVAKHPKEVEAGRYFQELLGKLAGDHYVMSRHQRGFKVVPTKGMYIGPTLWRTQNIGGCSMWLHGRGLQRWVFTVPKLVVFVAEIKRHKWF